MYNITLDSDEWKSIPWNKPNLRGICDNCNKSFFTFKANARQNIITKGNCFCSQVCKGIHKSKKDGTKHINCKNCNKQVKKYKSDSHSKNYFCSHSCSAQYNNVHRKSGTKRSRAEIYLANLIKNNYPQFSVKENYKTILPSGYELDILIEDIQLAIELNGPTHFIPIFGSELLNRTQNHDLIKIKETQELGITLLVINISNFSSFKKTIPLLDKTFIEQIVPFITEKMGKLGNAPSWMASQAMTSL